MSTEFSLSSVAKIPLVSTTEADRRLGHWISRPLSIEEVDWAKYQFALVGFPCDIGVGRNGGRVGAANAPNEIREQLYKMTPDVRLEGRFENILSRTVDLGNLSLAQASLTTLGKVDPFALPMEEAQEKLGAIVAFLLSREIVPIILGGGHETAYGHFLGYQKAQKEVSIVNWDVHTDVRPLKRGKENEVKKGHSGSPFRQALFLENSVCSKYSVYGLNPFAVGQDQLDFLREPKREYAFCEEVTDEFIEKVYRNMDSPQMVTFDMDSVDQAFAPGVSAPAAVGLSKERWLRVAYCAGRSKMCSSFDLVEINPRVDIDRQTARLGALTIWKIFQGLSER
ncbi:MAG: formimidoylglutamase [Pirellulaceae bacterium]|nr:formimidoylglutamase [Pirellulaceae bacterium]